MSAESDAQPYQGIRPWFAERFPDIVHPDLVMVYQEWVGYLSPAERSYYNTDGFTEPELAKHMAAGDEIGKEFAEALCEGMYGQLTPAEQQLARSDPEFLVQRTVERYLVAINLRQTPSTP